MSAVRTNEKLWKTIKKKLLDENGGLWDARIAQRAVQAYKKAGGTYTEDVKQKDTKLHKWTEEDWGYIDKPGGRYLPKKVRDNLTPAEKAAENKRKSGKLGKRVSYTASVTQKMREAKIF